MEIFIELQVIDIALPAHGIINLIAMFSQRDADPPHVIAQN